MPRQTLKQRKDGRYKCVYKGIQFYGDTQSAALAARDAYKRQEGQKKPQKPVTFITYSIRWVSTYKKNCQKSTYNQYVSYLNRAADHLPDGPIQAITPTDIQDLYNAVLEGMGDWTIKKFCMLISSVFESAFNDGLISRNPCASVKRPKGEANSHRAIEPWERELVLLSVGKHKMALMAMVMLYAGLRRGEALEIDVDRDVDLANQVIHVRGAVHFDTNQPVHGATKTKAGFREIPLFAPLLRALQGQHGLLFGNSEGLTASQTVFRRAWASYMRSLSSISLHGPVSFTPHDLRHSFCTMLYEADVDIKTAVRWMGHADEKMILRIYAHLSKSKEQEATEKVQSIVENLAKGSK